MAFSTIASYTMRGGITFTGNTLGLSQRTNEAVMGTGSSIGAFITLNTSQSYSNFPNGTTGSYSQNYSSANLVLPAGSVVEYAELIWAGNCRVANGANITNGILNNPISFLVPNSQTPVNIAPTIAFRDSLQNGLEFYMRAADVTSYVRAAGAGTYAAGHIPGIIDPLNANTNDTNFAGWTLAVIYRNLSLPLRNITLFAGGDIVRAAIGSIPGNSVTIPISGFITPFFGNFNARILLTAGEGDIQISGDQAFFTPPGIPLTSPAYALSGPRNNANNFFSSQICDDNGLLNVSGTFGNRNQLSSSDLMDGARQGWDITNVDASSKMKNGQTSATLHLTTSGDTYLPTGIGLQIDIASVELGINKTVLDGANWVSSKNVYRGEVLTFRITLTNPDANITLGPLTVKDPLPSGLSFQSGTVIVGDTSRPADNIVSSGVTITSLGPGQSVDITFQALVTSSAVNPLINTATSSYMYTPAPDYTINDERNSNSVSLNVLIPNISVAKSVSPSGTVYPGTKLTYTLIVSNLSNFDITDAVLTDPIPTGVTYAGGNTFQQVLGTIPSGTTLAPISFDVIVNDDTVGVLTNRGYLSYQSIAGNKPIASTIVTNHVLQPIIDISKSQTQNLVLVNDTLYYTFTIANPGPVPLLNLYLQDLLPDGISLAGDITLTDSSGTTTLSGNIESETGISLNRGLNADDGSLVVTVPIKVDDEDFAPYDNTGTVFYSYDTLNMGLRTRSKESNEVTLNLSKYPLSIAKSATPPTVAGDTVTTVTYTLTITATSDVTNLLITEPAPVATYGGNTYYMNYVAGSGALTPNASIGTITIPVSPNPITITIPYLSAGSTVYATFQATTQIIPGQTSTVEYSNIASYKYYFAQDPLLPNPTLVDNQQTNEVIIYQVTINVSIEKAMYLMPLATPPLAVNTIYPDEQVMMEITLVNHQETDSLTAFQIGDILDDDFFYSEDEISVFLEGTELTAGTDYTISSTPLARLTISFRDDLAVAPSETVLVRIPASRMDGSSATTLYNTGISCFELSSLPGDTHTIRTVRMPLTIIQPSISVVKTSSPSVVAINEPIVYTIQVRNTGDSILNQVILTDDALQSYLNTGILQYNGAQPIVIDGVPYSGLLPISLDTLAIGQTKTVQIRTMLMAQPDDNLINNIAGASGQTTLARIDAPNNTRTWGPVYSPNSVECLNIKVSIDKTVDKAVAMHGEELIYTLTLSNHSNRTLERVYLYDVLPDLTNFVPGSLTVNGVSFPNANIRNGLLLGSLTSQSTSEEPAVITVTYKALLQEQEGDILSEQVKNYASAYYLYRRTPDSHTELGITDPVSVLTTLIHPQLSAVKSVSAAYAEAGDTLTYTITLTNTGNPNLTNIILSDSLPTGVTLISPVRIRSSNGTLLYSTDGDLSAGIMIIGSTLPKETLDMEETILVAFDVSVDSVPPEEFINTATLSYKYNLRGNLMTSHIQTNSVLTKGITQGLSIVKNVTPQSVYAGQEVIYTILVKNTGNTPIQDVVITDPLTSNIILTTDYTTVDNETVYQKITDGITISQIQPGQTIPILFNAMLQNVPPLQNRNTSVYQYSYIKDPTEAPISVRTQPTNTVTLIGTAFSPGLTIVKSGNRQTGNPGEIVTYALHVTNSGNVPLTSVLISDPLPTGLTFVPSSIQINGTSVEGDITTGIRIPTLATSTTLVITFQAQLDTFLTSSSYTNTANATYQYQQGSSLISGSATSNPYTITVNITTNSCLRVEKTSNHALARPGSIISYTITVTNTGDTVLTSLSLNDVLDSRFTLDITSVQINNTPVSGNLSRLPLPDLLPLESAVITYSGTIQSASNGAPILNTATVSGLAPDSNTVTAFDSAAVGLYLSCTPRIKAVLSVNECCACVCDTLCYQITLTNTSNLPLTNLLLCDILTPALTFVPYSLTINDEPYSGGVECLALPNMMPGNYPIILKFKARITELPKNGVISNRATISYKADGLMFQTQKTNKVRTEVCKKRK